MQRSRARRWSTAITAGALALTLTACGDEEPATSAEERGAALYAATCAMCHGPQGQGTEQGPPLVHIIYEPSHHPDESFHRAVEQGVVPHHWDYGPMPPIPALDTDEIDDIIAYVRSLQRDAGIE